MKKITLIFFIMSTLIGCKKTEEVIKHVKGFPQNEDVLDINNSEGFPDIQIEKLLKAAEEMMHPVAIPYANEVLDEILKKDPKNKKALFYKAIIRPVFYFKGVYSKLLPYLKRVNSDYYNKLINSIHRLAEGPLKDLLTAEAKAFESEEEVRNYVLDFVVYLEDTRNYFRKNKNLVTTVQFNQIFDENYFSLCKVEKVAEGVYKIPDCFGLLKRKADINRADMEILHNIYGGFQFYFGMASSYSWDGFENYYKKFLQGELSTRAIRMQELKRSSGLGLLKKNHQLDLVSKIGVDIASSYRWALNVQRYVCPLGYTTPQNREESLFQDGFCISKNDDDNFKSNSLTPQLVRALNLSLKGAAGDLEFDVNKNLSSPLSPDYRYVWKQKNWWSSYSKTLMKKTHFAPFQFLEAKNDDLKKFLTAYDRCGFPNPMEDPTIGGLFPDGDGLEVFTRGFSENNIDCNPGNYYFQSHLSEQRMALNKDFLFMKFFRETYKELLSPTEYTQESESVISHEFERWILNNSKVKETIRVDLDIIDTELENGVWDSRRSFSSFNASPIKSTFLGPNRGAGMADSPHGPYPAISFMSAAGYDLRFQQQFLKWIDENLDDFPYGDEFNPRQWNLWDNL